MSLHIKRARYSARVGFLLALCGLVASVLQGPDHSPFSWPWHQPLAAPNAQAPAIDPDAARKVAMTEYLADKFRKSPAEVRTYVDLSFHESTKHPHVTPELILAIIQKESSLDPRAKSFYGAVGLMQVVPRFHLAKLQGEESLYDASVNIRVGAQILQEYISQAGGDLARALRKYSGNAQGYSTKVLSESSRLEAI